jgi:hypothetical protein
MTHDLDELHHVHRVEEVHADDAAGCAHGRGDLRDGERRRVRREQRALRRCAIDRGEHLALELDALRDCLDDAVGIGARRGEIVDGRDASECGIAIGGGELSELDSLREVLGHLVEAGLRSAGESIVEAHIGAHHCSDVRDAVAHGSGSDDGDSADLCGVHVAEPIEGRVRLQYRR